MKIAPRTFKPRSFRLSLRRIKRDDKGVAAVEFALILPLMVTLYLGCTEITQGVLASRKMAILSRTLSDIVAQQPTTITSPCTASGLCASTMTSIFSAASAVMSPFSTTAMGDGTPSLTMVVSSAEFVAYTSAPASNAAKTWVPSQSQTAAAFTPTTTDPGYQAMVRWSVTAASPNNATVRSCASPLDPVANTVAAAATNLPSGLYAAGSIIISDVTYKYDPSFGGAVLSWVNAGGATYMSMKNTTYMRPRSWTTYITYPAQSGVGAGCTG